MATKEQYEAALSKAERAGIGSLDTQQRELVQKLYKEAGPRGNRARKVIDGK